MKRIIKKIKKRFSIMIVFLVIIPLSVSAQKKVISGGNIGLGITTAIIPKTDKITLPDPSSFKEGNATNDKWPAICFTIDLGLVLLEHHQLSYEWCKGGYSAKIAEQGTNYYYVDKVTGEYKGNVYKSTRRVYRNTSKLFSYQYVVHIKKDDKQISSSIRFGPSIGTYKISAKTTPPDGVSPQMKLNDTESKQKVYGFGTGITFYPNKPLYIDIGYRYLSCKGLAIEDFKTKGNIHQISITFGLGSLKW